MRFCATWSELASSDWPTATSVKTVRQAVAASTMTTESTYQPTAPTPALPVSAAQFQRNWMFCPATEAGSLTVTDCQPPELPTHAERPPSGLSEVVVMALL